MLIALGSNLSVGNKSSRDVIRAAITRIGETFGAPIVESRHFRTPAFPAGSGPEFVNAAVKIEKAVPPQEVLGALHDIETEFGRERRSRWAARGLDLDLLAVDAQVLPDLATWQAWHDLSTFEASKAAPDKLILPHPRLSERGFVLMPLADIAPEWRHPILNKTVLEMLAALPAAELVGIEPLSPDE